MESPRTDRAARIEAALIAIAIPVCACAFTFRLTSFLLAKEALLYGLASAAVLVSAAGPGLSRSGYRFFLPLWVALLLAAAVHLVISPCAVPSRAIEDLVRAALFMVAAAVVYDLSGESAHRALFRDALLLSSILVAVLGLLQYAGLLPAMFPVCEGYDQRVYSVFGNQDLYGGYLAVGLPLFVWRFLTRQPFDKRSLLCFAILLSGLLVSGSRSAWLAACIGILAVIPYRRVTRTGAAILATTCIVIAFAAVCIAPESTVQRVTRTFGHEDQGGRLRLWFWDGALRMIRDTPLIGVGPGNYAYWSPKFQGEALHAPGGAAHDHNELHTQHPHSDPLDILAETGLLGAACWLWMLYLVARYRGPEWGGLAALLTFSLFNDAFHSAPHALAGLLLAVLLRAGHDEAHTGSAFAARSRELAAVTAMVAAVLTVFFLWAVLTPSYLRQKAEDLRVAHRPSTASFARAAQYPWPNAEAREQYGYALIRDGRYRMAAAQLEQALGGVDTGRIYLALAGLAYRRGDREEMQRWIDECYWRWPSSAALWELVYAAAPSVARDEVRGQAREWGISLDGRGRAYSATAGSSTP
ncbi:MAG: hypothetical protein QG656_1007 [Candidatus Hydrogenedentes bacterium]|nr:hypothetical protein [Candidatus Hydrogenedentota bacterium]